MLLLRVSQFHRPMTTRLRCMNVVAGLNSLPLFALLNPGEASRIVALNITVRFPSLTQGTHHEKTASFRCLARTSALGAGFGVGVAAALSILKMRLVAMRRRIDPLSNGPIPGLYSIGKLSGLPWARLKPSKSRCWEAGSCFFWPKRLGEPR